MPALVSRAARVFWTIGSTLTIVAAISISVVRLMLPDIAQHRESIESWLSDISSRPVQIGEVSASWQGWAPKINIKNLTLLATDRKVELAHFNYAKIEISPFVSLWRQRLVPRSLLVGGMQIALERDRSGKISIAGLPPSQWPVAEWLLEQRNFTLRDADITFTDTLYNSAPQRFSDVAVFISRTTKQQLVSGSLRRDNGRTESYVFELRATGNILSSQWDGDLFVDIRNAEASPALALAGWRNNQISAGQLNTKIWSRWESAKLQHAALVIDGVNLKFGELATELIDNINASAVAVRARDGWSLNVNRLRIQPPHGPASESTGSVRWIKVGEQPSLISFRANDVDFGTVINLVQSGGDKIATSNLTTLNPRANVDQIVGAIVHEHGHISRYFVEASVNDLSMTESARVPAVNGLDFKIRANHKGGVVEPTQTNITRIQSDHWLVKPVEVKSILGKITWEISPTSLNIGTEGLQILAESIDFSTRGKVVFSDDESPHLDLVTRIGSGELPRFHALIPKGLLRPRGEKWLRTAFRTGQFNPSDIVVRGYLDEFPFDQSNGTFKGTFEVDNVDLKYSVKFPITKAIRATVSVDGRKMKTAVHNGYVYRAAVDGSTIEMPDLFSRKPAVRMAGNIRVIPDDVGRFIAESPLRTTKASRYSEVDISGEFDMTLDMNLGLYPGADKEILGNAHFSDNRIDSKAQGIVLENVIGKISFTRQDWYGEGMTAVFDGDPVEVIFNGGLDDPNYDTEFRMTGTSNASQLLKYLKRYAPVTHGWLSSGTEKNRISGQFPWNAVLTIPTKSEADRTPKRLVIESNLKGLNVNLPWPFGKTSPEKRPLSLQSETNPDGSRVTRIDFGPIIDIEIDSKQQADGVTNTSRIEVLLGETEPVFRKTPGLTAHGRTTRLPLNKWIRFARAAIADSTNNRTFDLPISFDIGIDNLETLGRNFQDINVVGEKQSDAWNLEISAPQAEGQISIPRDRLGQPLVLDFERLWLDEFDLESKGTRVDPRKIPPLTLTAKSLRFGKVDLGSVELTTMPVENGVRLDRLRAAQSKFVLQGNGDWLLQGDVDQSRVSLLVYDKTLSGLLKRFDYEVPNIDGGKTKMEIEAIWNGTPLEFSLDKLHGSFELQVTKGRFLDIDPGGGRLFGLLSLQTLPRRLSLDFNDLFRKGLTFDAIEGIFELDGGNAYTNSLLMTGPSARIDISGRIGLTEQDYDQRATVTPTLSNTIPVASALFGPAGIGVGAVIFLGQKMFKSIPEQVDKILSREYSITGRWEQPVIERI